MATNGIKKQLIKLQPKHNATPQNMDWEAKPSIHKSQGTNEWKNYSLRPETETKNK